MLTPDEKQDLVRFVLAFAAVIVSWAALHDIHLISVEPKHFTDYHRKLLPISYLPLLALQYATVATLGPGLAFGFLAYFMCRWRTTHPRSLKQVLGGFVWVMIAIECVLLGIGAFALKWFQATQSTIFPESFYPELSEGIVYTQTVNIFAYLIAPITGLLYLVYVRFLKKT